MIDMIVSVLVLLNLITLTLSIQWPVEGQRDWWGLQFFLLIIGSFASLAEPSLPWDIGILVCAAALGSVRSAQALVKSFHPFGDTPG